MSFSRSVMVGSGAGLCTGFVGSAYFAGESEKYKDRDTMLDVVGELLAAGAAFAAPVWCIVCGTTLGGGYFATKRQLNLSALHPLKLVWYMLESPPRDLLLHVPIMLAKNSKNIVRYSFWGKQTVIFLT